MKIIATANRTDKLRIVAVRYFDQNG